MSVRTSHKGYGVHDVYSGEIQVGICFKCDNGRTWTGRVFYKNVQVQITGIDNMRSTTDRMAAIYNLLVKA